LRYIASERWGSENPEIEGQLDGLNLEGSKTWTCLEPNEKLRIGQDGLWIHANTHGNVVSSKLDG